jgi:hypothetical protein
LLAATLLLLAIWLISVIVPVPHGPTFINKPPFVVGDPRDVVRILAHNMLVLALHAMACVAGFIAGSSLPLQAGQRTGVARRVHELGRIAALWFVACATAFSLSWQAYALGTAAARVAFAVHSSSALLLIGLLPHAVPELVALFLPLAAWILASRAGEWDRLLAATLVTVLLATPVLVLTALWEVYIAPQVLTAMLGYH